jgi:hypothetical protein
MMTTPCCVQPPAGARTVPDATTYLRNNAVFNVKDYGATGNGTTDDTAAIMACINNARALAPTGAVVLFPQGVFITSGITLTSQTDLHITGFGRAGILKLKNAATPLRPVITLTSCSRVTISELVVDGNKASNTPTAQRNDGAGIALYDCTACTVVGSEVKQNVSGAGILVITNNLPNQVDPVENDILIAQNIIHDCGKAQGPSDGIFISAAYSRVECNRIYAVTDWGIACDFSHWLWVGRNVVHDYQGFGAGGVAMHHVTIEGNHIYSGDVAVALVLGTLPNQPTSWSNQIRILDNVIHDIAATVSTGNGIITDHASVDVEISGNQLSNIAGVGIATSVHTASRVMNNSLDTVGSHGIYNSFAASTIASNRIKGAAGASVYLAVSSNVFVDHNQLIGKGVQVAAAGANCILSHNLFKDISAPNAAIQAGVVTVLTLVNTLDNVAIRASASVSELRLTNPDTFHMLSDRVNARSATFLGAINSSFPNSALAASQMYIRVDEASGLLVFTVKYANGSTVKVGALPLS